MRGSEAACLRPRASVPEKSFMYQSTPNLGALHQIFSEKKAQEKKAQASDFFDWT
ncbi:MAG: hypothetical protein LBC55_03895 [Desulfovibrio sp.]|nr:hypothetical protein [Desulfovibrio sp.]